MSDYKRYTKRDDAGIAGPDCRDCELYGECGFTYRSCYERVKDRLAELEDKIENGTLIDIETVAKLIIKVFDDCPCNFHDIAEYMCEHYYDWCDKSCVSVSATGDYTPCWVKYLTAKLAELKGEQQ